VGLWQDRDTGKWKFKFIWRGKFHGGGGYKTKQEARTAREDRRKVVMAGTETVGKPTPTTAMAFSNLADLYLDLSERRHAPKTFRYKRYVYASFLRHCGDEGITVDKITPFLIQGYLHTRESNSNYNRHRKDLQALFEYARKVLGVVSVNPCAVIEKLPEEKESKKIPTQEEFIKMISAADQNERPLIMVLAYTAARIDEALRLRWEDINFEHGFIRLWTKKTKDGTYRAREIPMKDYMKSIMRGLWETKTQGTWVFFNEKTGDRFNHRPKFMRTLCRRAGIPRYGFHSIRHFISATLLDREKIGTPTVSRLLGHQNLSTTDIYAHSIGIRRQDDALDMAMDKLEAAFVPKLIRNGDTKNDQSSSL